MNSIIDIDLTQEQIDKLLSQLQGTEYLKIGERTFINMGKCEQLLIGFAKEKMKEFHDWLKTAEKTRVEHYDNGGWGEILLTTEELVEKFCHPDTK